jgi:hypothetical protein
VKKWLQILQETRKRLKRRQIERKFEELYAKAEEVLKRYNPCAIIVVKGKVHCIDCGKKAKSIFFKPAVQNLLCCGGCKFHNDKGCTAEKPLTCKLWLCNTAMEQFPKCYRELRELRIEANDWILYAPRGDKQACLKSAYAAAKCL